LIHAILLQENSDLAEIYVLSGLFSDELGAQSRRTSSWHTARRRGTPSGVESA
jgi:hypothetical protein